MEAILTGAVVVFLLVTYLGLGIWVFAGIMLVAISSLMLVLGYPLDRLGAIVKAVFWRSSNSWELAALPLFLWMGEIVFRTDISDRLFRGLSPLSEFLPGRLLHTNILGSTVFAAISGSSTATTATVGKITLSALKQRGYDSDLAVGSLAGAGSLGLLIPPSILMIVYGILAEVSIARLFAAGFLPGFLLAGLYSAYIGVRCALNPEKSPPDQTIQSLREVVRALCNLAPAGFLVAVVLGGIYTGIVTPSECAALAVVAALVMCAITGQLTWRLFKDSLMAAIRTNAMICAIILSAALLATAVGFLHLPSDLADFIAEADLSPYQLIAILSIFYLVLGCFLDGVSITVMSLPVTLPLSIQAGFDPVWFGTYLVIMIEMAQITPPIGFNLFVIQGLTGQSIGRVAVASAPFFAIMCLTVVLLVAYPIIALWLPSFLYG